MRILEAEPEVGRRQRRGSSALLLLVSLTAALLAVPTIVAPAAIGLARHFAAPVIKMSGSLGGQCLELL